MPVVKLVTDLDPDRALRSAWRAGQEQGYTLTLAGLDVRKFEARSGHFLLSHLAGPLAPHCRFNVSIEPCDRGSEILLDGAEPWLMTGLVGARRVRRRAGELMDAIAAAIQQDGGTVLS
jgi:hypothetical protein